MDPFSASAGPSSAPTALHAPAQLHSTTALLSSAVALAHNSLQDHIDDYADAHRWIDSFFDKIDGHRAPASLGAPRPGVFELMKTPGRKRTAGANSTNTHLHPPSAGGSGAGKDPLATLLFPPAPRSPAHGDKENAGSPAQPQRVSPRKMLSPLGGGAPPKQKLSPMRLGSPAPPKLGKVRAPTVVAPAPALEPAVKALDFAAAPAPVEEDEAEMPVHHLSNVVEEEEDAEELVQEASIVVEEEKADLSIIGEEEEEEDDSNVSAVTAPSTQPSLVASASIIPETQFSQPMPLSPAAAPAPAATALPMSPQNRTVSGASSVAPEADDAEDISVPLNDAPSALRSAGSDALRSSLSASTVHTPGNASSRFGTGSYSAAKSTLGSSPPPTAPSTVGHALPSARTSIGGSGARQINFVGLSKKKSLGLGLGLGRNWAASMGSSTANDSQGSIPSQSTQATTAPSSSHNSLLEPAQSGAMTATGATKRKSLVGSDSAHKAQKVDAAQSAQDQEAEEARKRREALANRIQSMQARQSNLGGRASNVAGPNSFASSIFGTGKPGASSLFHPTSAAPASKPLLATSSILPSTASSVNLAATSAAPDAGSAAVPRPSVMERVKSFEYSTSGAEHLHPPSPSKIPAAFSGPHSPRAMSPPPRAMSPAPGAMSPRGLRVVSPSAPASPRPVTRSATSGLPLATFGSPKLGSALARSPSLTTSTSAIGPLSIASVLSPPMRGAPTPVQQAQIPVALPKSPARSPVHTVASKPAQLVRSTTPDGSPPRPVKAASPAPVRVAAPPPAPAAVARPTEVLVIEDEEDELDEDEEDEEEVLSIRAINASTPASAIVEAQAAAARAKAAAEQAARDLEEQEAERERAALLQKRLPSLPEVQPPADDESADEDDEMAAEVSVVTTATREDLAVKASPSKIVMPGTFGAALAGKAKEASSAEASEAEDEDEDEDDEDRTTMSVMSTATTATLNLSHQPFKPITKTAQLPKQGSKSSLASSVSSTSAFGLNRSVGASGLKKPADTKVKSIQRAAAAAKKEKEETDRKNALKEQKRAALVQKKQDDERKLKAEGLEKKRKEREEAATKAKAGVVRGVKQKPTTDDEPAKKRKIEPEPKVRSEVKKAGQPTRPLPASSSSQHVSSLASSQGRPGAMGPPPFNKSTGPSGPLGKSAGPGAAAFSNPLSKSAGASAMVGQSFMSAKIRLPDSSAQAGPSRPLAPTVPKPFSSAMRPPQTAPVPAPKPAEPQEAYQELPDIDSEYSDSDEEAHERKNAELPRWARSPALAQALYDQQQVNPDEIFGPIPKLAIGEFFRNSASAARLRARTSSAQWDGTDGLTQTDLARYQRAMGYKPAAHASSTLADTPKEQQR